MEKLKVTLLLLTAALISKSVRADSIADYEGFGISSSSTSGPKNPLDIEILVSGTAIDPRMIRALSSGTDSMSCTQGTSPWVNNISQFGGSNVVTGTGNSGSGIPRVTVSNDSSITNITGTITLPTGASTDASLTNGGQKTQLVDGAGAVIGPAQALNGTNYAPVVLAASATLGAAIPARSVQVSGNDGTNAQNISVDTTGKLNINNISGTVTLPTLAATSTKQSDGTQKTQLVDGSGNVMTSTTISGTATNKKPIDVTSLSHGTSRYSTTFATQQTATTAADSTIFSMRNAAASTKTAIVETIFCRQGFNTGNPITRTQQTYVFQRFDTATPSGGTALTAALGDSSDSASQISDIRFNNAGLTVTSVAFSGQNLSTMACDTTQGITCEQPQLVAPSGWKLAPGEGLAIRLGVTAVIGVTISCNIYWREQ